MLLKSTVRSRPLRCMHVPALTASISLCLKNPFPLPPQIAVTLFDGKRERLTLNQSFTGACLRMYAAFHAFVVPFPPESPPQLATSMLTFQNSPRVYPSRFLAAFRPRSSVITTPRWCRLGCSTLWCGRRRAEEELGARAGAASIADRPQRRWFRGGLQQGYKRKKCVQMLLLSSRVCFAQLKLE
jgi:hypothetical protein